jgi:hypothetical protein
MSRFLGLWFSVDHPVLNAVELAPHSGNIALAIRDVNYKTVDLSHHSMVEIPGNRLEPCFVT